MTIKKIVSGGQTGAERAALDVAIRYSVAHGGWIAKGRKTDDGPLRDKYKLVEEVIQNTIDLNVTNSDGTLILTQGKPLKIASRQKKPCLHIDLLETQSAAAITDIHSWILENNIQILNVTGSRDKDIYKHTDLVVSGIILLDLVDAEAGKGINDYDFEAYLEELPDPPLTVEDAVDRLLAELDLDERVKIANMAFEELDSLLRVFGGHVRKQYKLWVGNDDLVDSCRAFAEDNSIDAEGCSTIILHQLWLKLRDTHRLRVVK
jgi:hypothetical protein